MTIRGLYVSSIKAREDATGSAHKSFNLPVTWLISLAGPLHSSVVIPTTQHTRMRILERILTVRYLISSLNRVRPGSGRYGVSVKVRSFLASLH